MVHTGALMDIETRRFAMPLERYRFPFAPGATWNQWVDNYNETTKREGRINRYVRVGGWEKVSTPAGEFDAIRMRVLMRLDDEEFWRYPTTCNYVIWYAPAVGAPSARKRRRSISSAATRWTVLAPSVRSTRCSNSCLIRRAGRSADAR